MTHITGETRKRLIQLLEEIDKLSDGLIPYFQTLGKEFKHEITVLERARRHLRNIHEVLQATAEISEERASWIFEEFFNAKEDFGEDLGASDFLENAQWKRFFDNIWDRILAVMDLLRETFPKTKMPEDTSWVGGNRKKPW